MVGIILGFKELWRVLRTVAHKHEARALILIVVVLLGFGTVFYAGIEKMRLLDAFYFSFVTLATIGYGDITPVTDIGKIFTVIYSILGIGTLSLCVGMIAKQIIEARSTGTEQENREK